MVCAPILAHAARPDRNAYLDQPVTSVSGLVAEIKHDPAVADRYMRHFGMSKDEVINMFSKMHVARLDRNTPVTMYSVPKGGAIKTHHTVMRKGERVFEDQNGIVILKVLCGNPVVGGRERTEVEFAPNPIDTASLLKTLTPNLDVTPEPTEAIATILPPDTSPDIAQAAPPTPPIIENITNNVTNTTVGGGGCKGLAGLLVVVPIAAFWGASLHHGCCPTPTPTPEPVSVTLLATGALGLVFGRRRVRA
ncbi:MAG: hypothetical protein ACYC96_11370 [Fimbriimonadaceae bacterium]